MHERGALSLPIRVAHRDTLQVRGPVRTVSEGDKGQRAKLPLVVIYAVFLA